MAQGNDFDIIVVGAGHAGCEAAAAASAMGLRTCLLTIHLDTIAQMSCNPAIGGLAKGHLVREIDALGGLMGLLADQTGIQFRLLNRSRGGAVQAPRAQCDKAAYRLAMKHRLEHIANLTVFQAIVSEVVVSRGAVRGVKTLEGTFIGGKSGHSNPRDVPQRTDPYRSRELPGRPGQRAAFGRPGRAAQRARSEGPPLENGDTDAPGPGFDRLEPIRPPGG